MKAFCRYNRNVLRDGEMLTRRWLLMALVLTGCASLSPETQLAVAGVNQFHRALSQGQNELIWKQAHLKFRQRQDKTIFWELLARIQQNLGAVTATEIFKWNVVTIKGQTRVTLVQSTTFAKGTGLETFVFIVDEIKAGLFSYGIESPELVVS